MYSLSIHYTYILYILYIIQWNGMEFIESCTHARRSPFSARHDSSQWKCDGTKLGENLAHVFPFHRRWGGQGGGVVPGAVGSRQAHSFSTKNAGCSCGGCMLGKGTSPHPYHCHFELRNIYLGIYIIMFVLVPSYTMSCVYIYMHIMCDTTLNALLYIKRRNLWSSMPIR